MNAASGGSPTRQQASRNRVEHFKLAHWLGHFTGISWAHWTSYNVCDVCGPTSFTDFRSSRTMSVKKVFFISCKLRNSILFYIKMQHLCLTLLYAKSSRNADTVKSKDHFSVLSLEFYQDVCIISENCITDSTPLPEFGVSNTWSLHTYGGI